MERSQRSLSLGLQTILLRGFGTVPGPIVFGFLMDRTCVLWRQNSDCDAEDQGACLIYNNREMSLFVLSILMVWRLVGALFFGGALYCTGKSKVIEEEDEEEEEEEESGGHAERRGEEASEKEIKL